MICVRELVFSSQPEEADSEAHIYETMFLKGYGLWITFLGRILSIGEEPQW